MRVSEVRTNSVMTKSNTQANYANKQAFSANTSLVTKKSIIFSVGRAILESEEFLNKLKPVARIRKAIAKANYKSPEDIRLENLVKKHRLEKELQQHNQVISDYKNKEIIPRETKLNEVIKDVLDTPLTNEEINELFRTPPFTNEQINEIVRNGRKSNSTSSFKPLTSEEINELFRKGRKTQK